MFLSLAFLSPVVGCSSATSSGTAINTANDLAGDLAMAFCAQQATCGCPAGPSTTDAGGTTTDGGSDAGAPATTSTKTATTSCPSMTTAADAGGAAGAASTCLERATLAAQQQLALISTAMNEGLLTFDPNIAATCVAAYQNRACTAAATADVDVQAAIDDPACASLFTGFIPLGERCDTTFECTPGGFCLGQATGETITSINGAGTLGICFAFQDAGAPCNTTADCAPPLTCNPTTLICE
jgi:hypothetical protein